ncbi:MAG: S9 family peptidase [Planctomycetes bacterium]|nr:S9 family peptidase [Planctomycetota bacterium]
MHFGSDNQWCVIDVQTGKHRCLTDKLGVPFHDELEDRPQPARAYGLAGWTVGERHVLVYDRYDIWKIDVASGAAECLTDGVGRARQVVLRISRFDLEGDDHLLDPDRRLYVPDRLLLSAHDDRTKASGYWLDSSVESVKPTELVMRDKTFGGLSRAAQSSRLLFTVSAFDQFPDLWVANLEFHGMRKLTDACPIQREVRWGHAELVSWLNGDGQRLQGILVKPEGFDPQRKYPMLVHFYERNADRVHRYVAPTAGTSPNAAYYVSNGYLWFVPDIVYTVGYPGESAEKCVISGVQHLIGQGFVDRKAIGISGHSWGGYQTAHLVTRTNLFAAAESGAPVSNMFSAYGGIRYQSGMSRQFQYERTQSRIGGTPWQYPQRFWQNSPVMYADRVNTPVLILHNDGDGAVPWTNGIEMFMALRRLDKEAYLFNYNGEPHGLRKDANKRDWSRRMAEFFDHHLRGKSAPRWMTEGVPYSEREREKLQFARSRIEAEAARSATGGGGHK